MNLRYRPNRVWDPKELTPGQSLLALLENSVAVRRQSELTLRTLRLVRSRPWAGNLNAERPTTPRGR